MVDDKVVRVASESRELVLSCMERYPTDDKVQGLACLALGNLANKHGTLQDLPTLLRHVLISIFIDESMMLIVERGGVNLIVKAMAYFEKNGRIQAAGSWAIDVLCSKYGRSGNEHVWI